ncbi:MAG: rhomboid family intramembrane serine protease [Armatimonadetes bacterium]|nr:rhomboid family intramembrane serine protease [Armatimonadota bacterium]
MTALWPILLVLLVPLPVGTDRRRRHVPWVTGTLIALNVAVYVGTVLYARAHLPGGDSLAHDLVYGPSDPDLFSAWGFLPSAPRLPSLFLSLFLHVNLGHLFWNMAFLWLFGPHVEDALGPLPFLILYLGGGWAAGLLHFAIKWLIPAQRYTLAEPLVGASGAISAIVAPFAVRYHRAQIRLLWLPGLLARSDWGRLEVPALAGLAIWLLQNLAGAVKSLLLPGTGGVAYWAHLGGFAFGVFASEVGGLLREGRQEYLLQEARAAASHGQDLRRASVQKYRTFLDRDSDNLPVRIELARVLVQSSDDPDGGRREAAGELLTALRACAKRHQWPDAVRLCVEANSLGLILPLTARERLRLAAVAEEAGQEAVAVGLLRLLIAETPDASEDEMARLKLGQLLLQTDPDEVRAVLAAFLQKYPQSPWTARARELLEKSAANGRTNV